jgi:membrane protein required for colicin V production
MTSFDITSITIVLLSGLLGLWRGLIYEVFSFLGWPIAYFISKYFGHRLAELLPLAQGTLRQAIAYILMFILGLLVWGMVVFLLSKLVKAIGFGGFNATLGGVFGLLRGVILVVALVSLAGLTSIPERPFWKNAQMSRSAEKIVFLVKPYFPASVAERIQFPVRS